MAGVRKPSSGRVREEVLRDQILRVACQLFIDHGVGGTTMQDIADALGISRPALYYYHKNKEALLKGIAEEVTYKAENLTRELLGRADIGPDEALRAIIHGYARLMLAHPLEFRVLDREEALLDRLVEGHAVAKRLVLENIAGVIRRGIQAGVFKVVDPTITALGVLGICNWTTRWFRPDGKKTAEEIAAAYCDFVLDAILRRNARRSSETSVREVIQGLKDDLRTLEVLAEQQLTGPAA